MNNKITMYKKDSFRKPVKTYLHDRLEVIMPKLMEKVIQNAQGQFVFEHAQFPDLKIQGVTIHFVQEHVQRTIAKQLKNKSDKHVDYILALLSV
jgi:hypothetical protein